MPGNIQVSVLGLMDVLLPPPLSSLSLKVVMGRKEYQSVGGGELFFPVVTLRDNLIVMVHDVEGQEMLRTEFRTMLLVEQGFWDDLFPLKDGGSIHLKLQFSLTEEDRKRIREKRDSAIRRKCVEKPRVRYRRSFSDNMIGGSSTITNTEITTEGMAFDPDKNGNASGTSTLQVSQQSSDYSLQKGAFWLTKIKDGRQLSSKVLHSQSNCLENITEPSSSNGAESEKYKYFSPKSKDMADIVLNSNVRKMISAFEGSAYQGVGPHFGQRAKFLGSKIGMRGSPKSAVAEGGDLNIPHTMLKSFSAGMLSEISLQGNSKHEESFFLKKNRERQHVHETCNETLGNKKQTLDLNNEEKIHKFDTGTKEIRATKKSSSLAEHPYSASSNSSVAIHNIPKICGTRKSILLGITVGASRERNDFASVKVEKGSSTIALQKSSDAIGEKVNLNLTQKADESSASHAASGTFKERRSPNSSEEMVVAGTENIIESEKNHSKIRIADGNATFARSSNNTTNVAVHFKERNEVHNLLDRPLSSKKMQDESEMTEDPCSTSIHQQGSSIVVSRTVDDENALQIPSNEQVVSGSAYLDAGVLAYGYDSVCPIGTLDIWTPRHLCISTGNKLLRDFVESCNVLEETTQIESHSMREANTKQKKDGQAYIQRNESDALPSSRNSYIKNLSGSLKSNGGLIEKVVQIVVVIVACGLLVNNR